MMRKAKRLLLRMLHPSKEPYFVMKGSRQKLRQCAAILGLLYILLLDPAIVISAPLSVNDMNPEGGCYYNLELYNHGEQIRTNEPCLNCTCTNHMLMCYLNTCPYSKPLGSDCEVERLDGQCCPSIKCPEVPVFIPDSQPFVSVGKPPATTTTVTTTPPTTTTTTTEIPTSPTTELALNIEGCYSDGVLYSDGQLLPSINPCELCYCIRNHSACVIQNCTLEIPGCTPHYKTGNCCPVGYDCANDLITTTSTTTTVLPITGCFVDDVFYYDGSIINTGGPCQHCYCMKGEVICAVQECNAPEMDGCTAILGEDRCCPFKYECPYTDSPVLGDDSNVPTTGAPELDANIIGVEDREKPESPTVTSKPSSQIGENQTEGSPDVNVTVSSELDDDLSRSTEIPIVISTPKNKSKESVVVDEILQVLETTVRDDVPDVIKTEQPIIIDELSYTPNTVPDDEVRDVTETSRPLSSEPEAKSSPEVVETTTGAVIADNVPTEIPTKVFVGTTSLPKIDLIEDITSSPIEIITEQQDVVTEAPIVVPDTSRKPEEAINESRVEATTELPIDSTDELATLPNPSPSPSPPDEHDIAETQVTTRLPVYIESTSPSDIILPKEGNDTGDIKVPLDSAWTSTVSTLDLSTKVVVPLVLEGQCEQEGVLYDDGQAVPSDDFCQLNCTCRKSVVECQRVGCEIPEIVRNLTCRELFEDGRCCPRYICGHTESGHGIFTAESQVTLLPPTTLEDGTHLKPDIITKPPELLLINVTSTVSTLNISSTSKDILVTPISPPVVANDLEAATRVSESDLDVLSDVTTSEPLKPAVIDVTTVKSWPSWDVTSQVPEEIVKDSEQNVTTIGGINDVELETTISNENVWEQETTIISLKDEIDQTTVSQPNYVEKITVKVDSLTSSPSSIINVTEGVLADDAITSDVTINQVTDAPIGGTGEPWLDEKTTEGHLFLDHGSTINIPLVDESIIPTTKQPWIEDEKELQTTENPRINVVEEVISTVPSVIVNWTESKEKPVEPQLDVTPWNPVNETIEEVVSTTPQSHPRVSEPTTLKPHSDDDVVTTTLKEIVNTTEIPLVKVDVTSIAPQVIDVGEDAVTEEFFPILDIRDKVSSVTNATSLQPQQDTSTQPAIHREDNVTVVLLDDKIVVTTERLLLNVTADDKEGSLVTTLKSIEDIRTPDAIIDDDLTTRLPVVTTTVHLDLTTLEPLLVNSTQQSSSSQPVDSGVTSTSVSVDHHRINVSSTTSQSPDSDEHLDGVSPEAGIPITSENFTIHEGQCIYDSRIYSSAQQIPREDPCDFCFCFRGDIICLQQSCPPPIAGCHEEGIPGFCCPRYECPVTAVTLNVSSPKTPTYPMTSSRYRTVRALTQVQVVVCEFRNKFYNKGELITPASSPCMDCSCGELGTMKCIPKKCQLDPLWQWHTLTNLRKTNIKHGVTRRGRNRF